MIWTPGMSTRTNQSSAQPGHPDDQDVDVVARDQGGPPRLPGLRGTPHSHPRSTPGHGDRRPDQNVRSRYGQSPVRRSSGPAFRLRSDLRRAAESYPETAPPATRRADPTLLRAPVSGGQSDLAGRLGSSVTSSVVEQELLAVQQRPEQVAEHLVPRRRPSAAPSPSPAPPPSAAGDSVRRNSSSISLVVVLLGRQQLRQPAVAVADLPGRRLAAVQVQHLRQRHLAGPLAGARRHPLGPAEQSAGSTTSTPGRAPAPPARPTG